VLLSAISPIKAAALALRGLLPVWVARAVGREVVPSSPPPRQHVEALVDVVAVVRRPRK